MSSKLDPRWLQIGFLSTFLLAGLTFLNFDIPLWQPPLLLGSCALAQWAMVRLMKVPSPGYLSAVITALGLALLLRSDAIWVPIAAAWIAIGTKFLIRFNGKHLFNPTNVALAAMMALTPHAWCSPSQWGESTILLAWFAVFGLAVVNRSFRSDICLTFLAAWLVLKAGRVFYLGQRWEVLFHQLSVGSLILFAFFMISDPKTTANHRLGRILQACLVAGIAFAIQHLFWRQNGLIWALLAVSPLTPLFDAAFKAVQYRWPTERMRPWLSTV